MSFTNSGGRRASTRRRAEVAIAAVVMGALLVLPRGAGASEDGAAPPAFAPPPQPVPAPVDGPPAGPELGTEVVGVVGTGIGRSTARATRNLAEIVAAVAEAVPEVPVYHCPVAGAFFIDSWGFRRSGGRGHTGVDMMAPRGVPVVAPIGGVLRHSNSVLGGLGFYLDGDDGTTYFGAHLASLGSRGRVEAGDQIGTVGSTGNASPTGPHLHFEVHPGDAGATNPYPFVADWCAGSRIER